ncbi:MAG: aminotransferase class V-fold PLP-dependent enzyme [Pseudohongiella sp.]|nr:aminotransferase class V-fold PLP-dependent enzyme [Pseudohongiella sp.]
MSSLIEKIRKGVIGQSMPVETVFGVKPLIYADYTASGRSLDFIEDFIRQQVLPFYANTHTETTLTGALTTEWRESARQMVRRAVNGTEQDKVIFCGSGATAAINKLISVMNLSLPADLDAVCGLSSCLSEEMRPVVFIGPYEHHSNELPWRESIAIVEVIPLDKQGGIDMHALEAALQRHQHRSLLIGSFSAASNVTGIKSDVASVTALLKRFGALACWDYAAAGPYVSINMNGVDALDAIFLSPHKFVGGPGTPGILVAKQHLFQNRVPAVVGGGTVMYVTPEDHVYVKDVERKEEGGTPAIIESIRAGLVFSLQQQVGTEQIQSRESALCHLAMQRLSNNPNIEVLGGLHCERLPIFSLRFRHQGKELHYGFVVSLLNDLFGIQVRGGCSCAGPYAHALLDMDMIYSKKIEAAVTAGVAVLRPGWVRLNFNYFISDEEFSYLLDALEMIAEFGWRMLPEYQYDPVCGVWRHVSLIKGSENTANGRRRSSIEQIDWMDDHVVDAKSALDTHAALVAAKQVILENRQHRTVLDVELPTEHAPLRWFMQPSEAQDLLLSNICN